MITHFKSKIIFSFTCVLPVVPTSYRQVVLVESTTDESAWPSVWFTAAVTNVLHIAVASESAVTSRLLRPSA